MKKMTLPVNTTFLPVLDDLLSPDLRPVLQTPTADFNSRSHLQLSLSNVGNASGTGNTSGSHIINSQILKSNGSQTSCSNPHQNSDNSELEGFSNSELNGSYVGINECNAQAASTKIQNWWRNCRRQQSVDIGAERAKHSIRHNRTEDRIMFLESEVNRLKQALASERKLRLLQLDAIRTLWSQVQKMEANFDSSFVGQSIPTDLCSTSTHHEKNPISPKVGHSD